MFEKIIINKQLSNKRLDQILTELEIVSSRNKATSLIMSGKVFVNEKKMADAIWSATIVDRK